MRTLILILLSLFFAVMGPVHPVAQWLLVGAVVVTLGSNLFTETRPRSKRPSVLLSNPRRLKQERHDTLDFLRAHRGHSVTTNWRGRLVCRTCRETRLR